MPERDPATMTWLDAWRMVHRAYLHVLNQDTITGEWSIDARMLLINLASSIR